MSSSASSYPKQPTPPSTSTDIKSQEAIQKTPSHTPLSLSTAKIKFHTSVTAPDNKVWLADSFSLYVVNLFTHEVEKISLPDNQSDSKKEIGRLKILADGNIGVGINIRIGFISRLKEIIIFDYKTYGYLETVKTPPD